jgi:addiction module HigA family antidote
MARKRLPPIHPGELLRDELNELGISLNRLARDTRMPLSRVSLIVNGRRSITADTAMRLAQYFGTSAQMWMNLQTATTRRSRRRKRRPSRGKSSRLPNAPPNRT